MPAGAHCISDFVWQGNSLLGIAGMLVTRQYPPQYGVDRQSDACSHAQAHRQCHTAEDAICRRYQRHNPYRKTVVISHYVHPLHRFVRSNDAIYMIPLPRRRCKVQCFHTNFVSHPALYVCKFFRLCGIIAAWRERYGT